MLHGKQARFSTTKCPASKESVDLVRTLGTIQMTASVSTVPKHAKGVHYIFRNTCIPMIFTEFQSGSLRLGKVSSQGSISCSDSGMRPWSAQHIGSILVAQRATHDVEA